MSKPNQVSWEEKNKNKIAWFCGHTRGYVCECDKLKNFIRSLLKEERERVIRELAHETADGYCCACGYDIAGFETEINKLKSKLSKGKV